MKKTLIIAACVLAACAAAYLIASSGRHRKPAGPVGGSAPEDFTLGPSGSGVCRLSNLLGRYTVVLMFTDNGPGSRKLEMNFREKLDKALAGRRDVPWFVIKRDGSHAVIEEQTGALPIRYRCSVSDIPGYYSFRMMPAALVIDKSGVVKLVYSGYSPSIFSDITGELPRPGK